MLARNDSNQSPLGSPAAADNHASIVIGAESGASASVDSCMPNAVAASTSPFLIGRNKKWSGMLAAVCLMVAMRSLVRLLQPASAAQS